MFDPELVYEVGNLIFIKFPRFFLRATFPVTGLKKTRLRSHCFLPTGKIRSSFDGVNNLKNVILTDRMIKNHR